MHKYNNSCLMLYDRDMNMDRINIKEGLLRKIKARTLTMGVVGLGYVGLPLAVEKAKAGYNTIGFDVQKEKVDQVNRGENYIGDVVNEDLQQIVKSGFLKATSDFSFVADVDFVAICVPTPLDSHQQPNVSYLKTSSQDIAKHLTKGTVVVLESTTYPGTTEELIKPILEEGSGLKCGEDFYLGFSPERVDPGNKQFKTKNTPKVVGAIGEDAKEVIAAVYSSVLDGEVHTVSSPAVAEMEKILENTYRNINIGLVNELAILCHKMEIDIWEVIDAAKTKPYGFQAFYPGPGLGGHCIPLDPYYLSWKAREYDFHTSMIEASMMINDRMPEYTVDRAIEILNNEKKAMNGSKILALGVAYKADIDDYRESPALDVIDLMIRKGAEVDFYDPLISKYKFKGEKHQGLKSMPSDLSIFDLVILLSANSEFDYNKIAQGSKVVFDTRNAFVEVKNSDNIHVL